MKPILHISTTQIRKIEAAQSFKLPNSVMWVVELQTRWFKTNIYYLSFSHHLISNGKKLEPINFHTIIQLKCRTKKSL